MEAGTAERILQTKGERMMSWYSDGEPFDEYDDPYCVWRQQNGIECGYSAEECRRCEEERNAE